MDLEISKNEKNITSNTSFSKELENYISKENDSFSIDRFEEEFAVCENRKTNEMINIPKSLLPENCKSGDIIILKNGKYVLDVSQTKKEQDEIKNLVNNLFKKKN